MDSIHGLEESVDPMQGLEEKIVRAVVAALKEGQRIEQLGVVHFYLKNACNTVDIKVIVN